MKTIVVHVVNIFDKTKDAVINQHNEELFYYEYADMNTNMQTKNQDL